MNNYPFGTALEPNNSCNHIKMNLDFQNDAWKSLKQTQGVRKETLQMIKGLAFKLSPRL